MRSPLRTPRISVTTTSPWLACFKFTVAALLIFAFTAVPVRAQDGVWTTASSLPAPQGDSEAAVIDGELYSLDPASRTELFVYDPTNNTWISVAPIPSAMSSGFGAAVGDKFYIVGGCAPNGDCNSPTSAMQIYDASSNTWSSGPSAPVALSQRAGGVINGKIYVAGGSRGNFPGGGSNELDVFDPVAGTWTIKSPMPTPRLGAFSAVVNGKLYVAGGISENVPQGTIYSTLEIYDPATDTWAAGTSMPNPEYDGQGAEANGFFYIAGGVTGIVNNEEVFTNAAYAYNPGSDNWSSVTPIPVVGGVAGSNVLANINGRLYLVGGLNSSAVLSSIEVFTPSMTSGFAQLNGGNTFTGSQTINGTVSATSFAGDGSGLTGVNAQTAGTAFGLACTACVTNTMVNFNYALSNAPGGDAVNALMLGGYPASFFATASGDPNYAPASGSGSYVSKSGDTMTGTLNLPANGLLAGTNQFVLAGGFAGVGTASPITPFDARRNGSALANGSIASDSNAVGYFENNGNATNVWLNVKAASSGGTDENYYFALNGAYVAGLRYNVSGDYLALFHNHNNSNNLGNESFVLKNGNVGIGTTSPQATLEVNGTAQFDSSVTFAAGQAFPGTGTITGLTAGTGLTGGGSTGNVTLNVNQGIVAFQTDLSNGVTTAENFATSAASAAQTNAITAAETFSNSTFVPLAGGTMTGTLNTPAVNVSGNAAVTGATTTGNLAIGNSGTPITKHISMVFQNVAFNTKLSPTTCTMWNGAATAFPAAADGDTVAAGLGSSLMNVDVVFSAWAVNGGVEVRICNPTGKPVTLASGNVRIDLWKH